MVLRCSRRRAAAPAPAASPRVSPSAATDASRPPPGDPSPARPARLSFAEAAPPARPKRAGIRHATPSRGAGPPAAKSARRNGGVARGRRAPIATARAPAPVVAAPAVAALASAELAVDAGAVAAPTVVAPTVVATTVVTLAAAVPAVAAPTIATPTAALPTAALPTAATPTVDARAPATAPAGSVPLPLSARAKKVLTTRQKNTRAVVNNDMFEWPHPSTFNEQPCVLDGAAFKKWDAWFRGQIRCRFRRPAPQAVAAQRVNDLGLGRRSLARDDMMVDSDARLCSVTDVRRLSRLHFEDLLCQQVDAPLLFYFKFSGRGASLSAPFLESPFLACVHPVAEQQRAAGTAGTTITIAGSRWLPLKATIITANAHHDAVSGGLSLSQLSNFYDRREGFTVRFANSATTLTISWALVVELSAHLLIFGAPLDGSRRYTKCFQKDRRSIPYLRRIYHNLAHETLGDVYSSSALVTAFDERLIQLLEAQVEREKLSDPGLDFNESPNSARFFRVFDIMCCNKLKGAICGLNNYNKPII